MVLRYWEFDAKCAKRLLFFLGGKSAEVLLDDVSIVGREIAANLLQGFFALLRRQITPAAL